MVWENASEKITEDKALASIQNYCLSINPDLENIMNEGQYPVYFEVVSANEEEIVKKLLSKVAELPVIKVVIVAEIKIL